MTAQPEPLYMTESEYLEFERDSDVKHEYLNGEVFAMAGASAKHSLICSYVASALIVALGEPCAVYQSDMRVKVKTTGLFTYPDVSVGCEDPQYVANIFDTLLNPIVLIEVLSPSTEAYDRGKKFQDYRQIPSLQEYLLISQDSPRIERYLRRDDNTWTLTDAIGLDATIEMPSLGCTLMLSDVYRKVKFESNNDTI